MKARHAGCRRIQTIFRKNRAPCYLPCRTGIPVLHDGDTLGKATKNHLLACPGVFPAEVRDPCIRRQVDDTAVQVFESSCKSCGCMNARVHKVWWVVTTYIPMNASVTSHIRPTIGAHDASVHTREAAIPPQHQWNGMVKCECSRSRHTQPTRSLSHHTIGWRLQHPWVLAVSLSLASRHLRIRCPYHDRASITRCVRARSYSCDTKRSCGAIRLVGFRVKE